MFDRFTSRAVQVLFHARAEAGRLGSSVIAPEHILLGVLDEGEGLGSRILARSGATLDDWRRDIVSRLTTRESVAESAEIPFSDSCKRALEYAAGEADRLLHDQIGTEHLVLGLLREEGSAAADVLAARGLDSDEVRAAIVELLRGGEQLEPPGPPSTPANTYQWPQIPFVPSTTVHILHSGMRWPQPPVINHADTVFSAYGFTLEEIVVRAWEGSRWHVDIAPELRSEARFDFLMVLPQQETSAVCLGLLRSGIEQQFAVQVTRESRIREVYRLTHIHPRGRMLRRYPDPAPGTGVSWISFSTFTRRSQDAPMFPLEPFAVHSVPFAFLLNWFEEILGSQVIDDTGLAGIYGFELTERVNTSAALMQLLRDDAGLLFTQERREIPTLVVRRPSAIQAP